MTFNRFATIYVDDSNPMRERGKDARPSLTRRVIDKVVSRSANRFLGCITIAFLVSAQSMLVYGQVNAADTEATTGSIQGTVKYIADFQRPWRLGRYYIRNLKSGELAEAVVAISKRGLKGPDEKREPVTAVVDQKDFQFTPETTAIRVGDHVRFLNNDDHTHNVRTSHPKQSFNVSMPVGSEHTESFDAAGGIGQPYRIDCVFHTAMQSWIFVFDHPWFQVTAADGKFIMKNVPAGEYRFDAVHPAGHLRVRQTIQVAAGETTTLDIRLQPSTAKP